jgi:hypothetical protein
MHLVPALWAQSIKVMRFHVRKSSKKPRLSASEVVFAIDPGAPIQLPVGTTAMTSSVALAHTLDLEIMVGGQGIIRSGGLLGFRRAQTDGSGQY